MKVRFWGTRGSLAKPGAGTVRYGGNTSCVEIGSKGGTRLVIDCGTGGHELGQKLLRDGEAKRGHLLISHTHWDHIQGIPFFAPLFVPGNEWDVYAPQGFGESLRETLAGQMEYTYFPVSPEAFGAKVRYRNLGEGRFEIDDLTIRTRYLNHPALTLAYRIEGDGVAIVYACDHEPHSRCLATAPGPVEGEDLRHAEFLAGADLVIHDAQYLATEYDAKVGWGHSTVEYAVSIGQAAGVKRLALTHHDPLRTDDQVDETIARLHRDMATPGMAIFAAAEGQEIELTGAAPVAASVSLLGVPEGDAVRHGAAAETPLLLLVSADQSVIDRIERAIANEPIRLKVANTIDAALEMVTPRPALVVADDRLLTADGARLMQCLRMLFDSAEGGLPVLFLGQRPASDAQDTGVDWLEEPWSVEYVRTRIRTWLMRAEMAWARADLPTDEAERVGALRALGILDTPPEDRFDRHARLAAALFRVPVALISLVDADRQWFKARIGIDACETSRDVSFCAHAVADRDLLVVNDTLADPRFRGNPLVTGETRIRFYAGMPLFLSQGHCAGTLCVIDSRPRDFPPGEQALLRDLAGLVEMELERSALRN